jgi:sterol desaturase/sphingolipid hydroxylase (fatty acid hydroxylase superfamily)
MGATALTAWGLNVWPTDLPFLLQLTAALVVAEFGTYWAHRLFHESSFLWPVHAVHHTVERMHCMAAGRTHPIGVAAAFLVSTAILVLLGVPAEIIALVNVFTGVNGLLQHANLDMRIGPFSWILAGPDLHHYHHSQILAESNANYGSNLIVWDVVFGTRHAPQGQRPSTRLGLSEASLPEDFLVHLALPFTYARTTARHSRPAPSQPAPPSAIGSPPSWTVPSTSKAIDSAS